MAAVPIYVWNGTAWQETGPTIPASPIKYQASAPTSPSTGDIWVDSDADVTSGSQQFQRFRFVASGGETTISGNDANGATLAYTAGAELVVLNGSTLVRGQDYTATNGTSITGLSPALVANDVLEVFSFIAFNVANTYTQTQVDGFVTSLGGTETAWTSFTPTTTNMTVGNGTFECKYKQIGKTVFASYRFVRGSTSSFSNAMTFSLPVTAKSANESPFMASLIDINGSYSIGHAWFNSTTSVAIWTTSVGATWQNWAYVNNTDPFTWASGDIISFNMFYEAA